MFFRVFANNSYIYIYIYIYIYFNLVVFFNCVNVFWSSDDTKASISNITSIFNFKVFSLIVVVNIIDLTLFVILICSFIYMIVSTKFINYSIF